VKSFSGLERRAPALRLSTFTVVLMPSKSVFVELNVMTYSGETDE